MKQNTDKKVKEEKKKISELLTLTNSRAMPESLVSSGTFDTQDLKETGFSIENVRFLGKKDQRVKSLNFLKRLFIS
uniref:Uncharacterized protein n=1 Tax=Romanomermis culicivorax TaxID=13658 RepID=A0A915K7N3_ROMCU